MRGVLAQILFGGHFWLAANVLLAAVIAVEWRGLLTRDRRIARVTHFVLVLALAAAALGAPPLPTPFLLLWGAAVVVYLAFVFDRPSRRESLAAVVTLAIVVAATACELRYFFATSSGVPQPGSLVVIGDSLSSGGFGEAEAWPLVIGRALSVPVTNISRASATAEEFSEEIDTLAAQFRRGTVVLVQAGGNDMLEGAGVKDLERDLARIVRTARLSGAAVAILELPSLPLRSAYPAAQRSVARRERAALVPRRVILSGLTCRGCVSDGLHLTDRGHERLALALAEWLR
jgi:lysophospholipase L1-like esterase